MTTTITSIAALLIYGLVAQTRAFALLALGLIVLEVFLLSRLSGILAMGGELIRMAGTLHEHEGGSDEQGSGEHPDPPANA